MKISAPLIQSIKLFLLDMDGINQSYRPLCENELQSLRAWDQAFLEVFAPRPYKEFELHPLLPLKALEKSGYLENFPHLVHLVSAQNESPQWALAPCVCLHFFWMLQGQKIKTPLFLTARCSCFRNEQSFRPLKRQRGFSMREFVCLGTSNEVEEFVATAMEQISSLALKKEIQGSWQHAQDPFYQAEKNPKFLMQKLNTIKQEFVAQGLALASVNRHYDFFSKTFEIFSDQKEIHSACVGMGLERWVSTAATSHDI